SAWLQKGLGVAPPAGNRRRRRGMNEEDHIVLMQVVARLFFGKPNPKLSNGEELFFGDGAQRIDLKTGFYVDDDRHESGDVIDLIRRHEGLSNAAQAYAWAEEHGFWANGHAVGNGNGHTGGLNTHGTHRGYAWHLRGIGDEEQMELEFRKWLAESLLP